MAGAVSNGHFTTEFVGVENEKMGALAAFLLHVLQPAA
jgi:hypothetical protein